MVELKMYNLQFFQMPKAKSQERLKIYQTDFKIYYKMH